MFNTSNILKFLLDRVKWNNIKFTFIYLYNKYTPRPFTSLLDLMSKVSKWLNYKQWPSLLSRRSIYSLENNGLWILFEESRQTHMVWREYEDVVFLKSKIKEKFNQDEMWNIKS